MRRGRFAPTPSGLLHIGNARTALLAWLQMRKVGGTIVMRIEDIDQPRCKPEYVEQLLLDMRWLGLDWDEGPDIGGPYGPYEQSRRLDLYEEALRQLERDGRLYSCYCSRAQLMKIASAPHGLAGEGPAYPGWCRHLSESERKEREAKNAHPFVSFCLTVPSISTTSFSGRNLFLQVQAGILSYAARIIFTPINWLSSLMTRR